jgi:hypothetical protein
MRLLLTLVFVVACRSDDRAARANQDSVNARLKAERETAYVAMERARVGALVAGITIDKAFEEEKKLHALEAQIDHMRADLGTAKTTVKRQAIATKLDELEVKRTAITEVARELDRAVPIEQQRIDALPASCFTNPPPADCKIPPEIAEGFWRTERKLDATSEPVCRATD